MYWLGILAGELKTQSTLSMMTQSEFRSSKKMPANLKLANSSLTIIEKMKIFKFMLQKRLNYSIKVACFYI